MIMTAEEFAVYYDSDKPSNLINAKLKALESLVRKYTNNNFQKRAYRRTADIIGGLFLVEALTPFKPGDTVQITNSEMNEGLYTVKEVDDSTFSVNEVGVQSETISRHSVTYFNMDGDNSIMGYPKSLLGFLKPYKKARF